MLDAIQRDSEKLLLDASDDVDIEQQPILITHTAPKNPRSQNDRRLSRKGRWILTLSIVVLALVTVKIVGMRQNTTDLELLSSIVEGGPKSSKDRGFGCLNTMLDPKKTEKLFLSIPSAKSALDASRKYATHPHLAGSVEDYGDAKVILGLFQTQLGIPVPENEPVFPAGSPKSRKATLDIPSLSSPQAWIDVYYPLMNTPLDRSLEILDGDGSVAWAADLVEDGDPLDPEAAKYRDAVPTFHGLSKGGEVEGEIIFANYGTKEDYDALVAAGADLTGKIVVVRYGEIFRGLKIKGAQERGAAGVLIYSDPRDDGVVTVENGYAPYPAGPARNPTAVQRGSVQFISLYPGDPTTPGHPAYENSTRTEGISTPSIPSLPISWQNAERLLEEIGSSAENRLLIGKASKKKVKLVNHVDEKVTPIWNTMAVISGHIRDEVVIVGNHRDAWVMGGADPTSGTVSLHEIIRSFGGLLRSGWKPLRTIVFASWDAEEYGLVGSTEWGEDFADWIKDHVVAYVQTDVSVAGSRFIAMGSPSLAQLIAQTAKDVPHPTKKGKSLWDAVEDQGPYEGAIDPGFQAQYDAKKERLEAAKTGVPPLGSGSDYTVFLQHIGVASSDQGFAGTPYDAPYHYHSIYDSQRWQELYADPGFHRHVAVAKSLGLLVLRIADAITLPLNTTQYALELDDYLDVVENISSAQVEAPDLSALRKSIKKLQKASLELDVEKDEAEAQLREFLEEMRRNVAKSHGKKGYPSGGLWGRLRSFVKGVFGVHSPPFCDERYSQPLDSELAEWFSHRDPPRHEPKHEHTFELAGEDRPDGPPHHLHGSPPMHEHEREPLAHQSLGGIPVHKFLYAARRVRHANQKLASFERGFISEGGIKDREWYKHLGVAPGKWLGYGATTLPALTEALTIEQNVTLAEYEVGRLRKLIDKLTANLVA